ncbi:hypothetical protein QJS10_CPB17g02234 [Acorus calamus]|uniref:Glutamine amidotransferase domain-containing protein n=1 Tax=Acorus calamus TaxID=4465 RepID=A0AAV9CVN6_ACOCL|nr:hypothetical protein QJS10_CPB17g02234 [Acorus calamus]
MAEALCMYIKEDRPFLGICLVLRLLFEQSEENGLGEIKGLGLIPGVVGRFDSYSGIKVPHIGWNALKSDANRDWISSTCNYGDNFIASVQRGNVHAVQFHPEKSGDVGLSILRRYLDSSAPSTIKGRVGKLPGNLYSLVGVHSGNKVQKNENKAK